MGVVDEPVEDGVGVGLVADDLMPCGHRKLAGDDGRAAPVALLEDLQEVMAGPGVERFEAPVIQDQELHAAELGQEAGMTAVAACEGQGRE